MSSKETNMSLSDDPKSSTEKNRARTSQKPRESRQDSSFLRSKETEMSLSNDPLAPREKNRVSPSQEPRESPQNSSFLRYKETDKKSQTSMSQETQKTSVSPINTYEEVLKSRYDSYWENPNYYDTDDIIMNNANMLNPSGVIDGGMFEGFLDSAENIVSQKDPEPTQMKPTSGYVKNNNDHSNISVDGIDLATLFADSSEDSQLPCDNLQASGEGYGINTSGPFENKIDISFGSFGSIESMMNAKSEREKIVMIPTPRIVNAPQWTIKKILTNYDIYSKSDTLVLKNSSFDEHIRRHMPEADIQKMEKNGIFVNVYDYDMGTTHKLRLSFIRRNYGLSCGWLKDFVRKRWLRIKDEIGLLWDSSDSRLVFGVISRSTQKERVERRKY